MRRPDKIQCEDCGAWAEQQRLGARRRFCDGCRELREQARVRAWKQANPEANRRYNRESARRRRRDGRLT